MGGFFRAIEIRVCFFSPLPLIQIEFAVKLGSLKLRISNILAGFLSFFPLTATNIFPRLFFFSLFGFSAFVKAPLKMLACSLSLFLAFCFPYFTGVAFGRLWTPRLIVYAGIYLLNLIRGFPFCLMNGILLGLI